MYFHFYTWCIATLISDLFFFLITVNTNYGTIGSGNMTLQWIEWWLVKKRLWIFRKKKFNIPNSEWAIQWKMLLKSTWSSYEIHRQFFFARSLSLSRHFCPSRSLLEFNFYREWQLLKFHEISASGRKKNFSFKRKKEKNHQNKRKNKQTRTTLYVPVEPST